jgi:site-specific DNA-methyltransferase (adenine-specific)
MTITLHNSDCLEAMKGMPDKAFELAIVDPPYSELCNLHEGSSSDMEHGWGKNWASNKHFQWNKRPPAEYFIELKRVSENQIIWGGNYFINDLQDTSCVILWDKGQRDFSLADAEMAWTSFKKPLRIFTYSRAENNKTNRIHVNQKPVSLYKWLLKNYAKEGDKILDTHLGSGSIAIACYDLGFDLTGYEIDKEYFDAAQARLDKHMAQGRLFEPVKTEQTQESFI